VDGFLGEKVKFLVALFVAALAAVIILFAVSGGTELQFSPAVAVVGIKTPVAVRVVNSHGIRRFTAALEQDGHSYNLFETSAPARRFWFWRGRQAPATITFEAGKNKAPGLRDGKARLVVETVSNDLRGRTDTLAADVEVVTRAPRVAPDEAQHYINQGGMELVTFTASGYWTSAGVKVGRHSFRSFPLPGQPPERRFAMFAYAWDLPPDLAPAVFATNPSGAEATGRFWFKLFPKKFRVRDFELSDALLEKLVNSVDPGGQGELLARFLRINGELRRQNNQTLADLRFKTEEKILWQGPFEHWGKEESYFADVRNYIYQGKKVDQQVHLGYDLSDVANGPVKAANDGRVVYAADLGIYGNTIVLDHGYALQSIYGHLSRIDVKVGDMVKKNQVMGRAGSTGLAGGVHVHFSMQIDGVQVNPREWWDAHWIQDRILSKIGQP
jgi:murein DD-endopeptidase MepM/ murein hydrolase activator NlpD